MMTSEEEHNKRDFENAISRLGFYIKLNPIGGERFVEAFLNYKIGPKIKGETEPTRDYAGFWNAVYEIDSENFPESSRAFVKNNYQPPENPHIITSMLIKLAETSQHKGLQSLLHDVMMIYATYPIKVDRVF